MQIAIEQLEPVAVLLEAYFWEMRRVPGAVFRMRQTPVVRAVKTHLNQLRPGLPHKGQIILVRIVSPMGNHGCEVHRSLKLDALGSGT